MSSVFADYWFPYRPGDYTKRSAGLHSIFFDALFSSLDIKAMFCIDIKAWRLLAFWGARFGKFSEPNRLGTYTRLYSDMFESLGGIKSALDLSARESEVLSRRELIRIKLPDTSHVKVEEIKVYVIDKYAFVFFAKGTDSQRRVPEAVLRERVIRAIDYIDRAQPFFDNIPNQVFQIQVADNKKLFEEYFGPHSFCPRVESDIPFLWPWQRSLVPSLSSVVRRRSIATTSLVLDIRNSTTAMMLSKDPERFSDLISTVIDLAKTEIVMNGGFFDKETGDGIVGHFCEEVSSFLFGMAQAQSQAFAAARAIKEKINGLFEKYQENLTHGIASFGPAIGIHNSNAVWIFSREGIRAIGESVVGATRLCKNAKAGEIIVSNSFLHSIIATSDIFKMENFKRRKLVYAEIKPEAGPFGYVFLD